MEELTKIFKIMESRILNALLIFFLIVVLAKIVDLFIDKVARRIAKLTKFKLDDKIIDLIHKPIFLTIMIIGAIYTIQFLNASEKIIFYTNGILYSVLTIVWGICIARISNLIIEDSVYKMADITGLGKEVIPLIENVWKVVIIAAGFMVILSLWKVSITPFLASAGIIGVAVAFAAKDTIANFFGGISIFVDRPYKIGDYIVLDQGERGEVVEIGIRSTRIKTRDDILISIPNSIIANTKIINESAPIPNFRVRIRIGVAYGSDIEIVEKILTGIASENENVLKEPEPRARFREFGESSLNFELLCWIKEPALRGLTVHELNRTIYKKFNEGGIKIPFPQRDIHICGKEGINDL
jgi:small-conductance mechanosensitive channel